MTIITTRTDSVHSCERGHRGSQGGYRGHREKNIEKIYLYAIQRCVQNLKSLEQLWPKWVWHLKGGVAHRGYCFSCLNNVKNMSLGSPKIYAKFEASTVSWICNIVLFIMKVYINAYYRHSNLFRHTQLHSTYIATILVAKVDIVSFLNFFLLCMHLLSLIWRNNLWNFILNQLGVKMNLERL